MFWMLLAIVLLFVILGIVFSQGRGANLLAGYNTMSKDQKARYDARALCRFMGKIMFILAACMLVMALAEPLAFAALLYIGLGFFLAVTVFTVVYANTGNRFQKK